MPAGAGNLSVWQSRASPTSPKFASPFGVHQQSAPKISRFWAGCAATPEALLLAYIPVRFDLYRTVRRHLHFTLQCLVGFADKAGQCWPSCRKLAAVAGLSKSTM